ncbi:MULTISPECIES: hypothetical protein [Microvirga]|uniref:hypothetical protein n=1 Tax=Microvirga TaxID=186650 RepID=UPI00290566C8|nr:hypothetical protein [Microvirga sp. HBU67655]
MAKPNQAQQGSGTGTFSLINASAKPQLQTLLSRWLPDGHLVGSEWVARNPRRNDRRLGSFKVNVNTGQWADFATGDRGGDSISLYAYLHGVSQGEAAGLLMRELKISNSRERRHSPPLSSRGAGEPILSNPPANVQTVGCTLESYARTKQLSLPFLQSVGLSEITYQSAPAVRIPYKDQHGNEPAIRFRIALDKSESGDDRFRWKKGAKPCLYGLWQLQHDKPVVLVEGESDCHTLWHHGINAVGLPRASMWKEERDAPHLQPFDAIYVVVEPDQGGEATLRWTRQSALRDRIRLVRLDGFKDPSALHLADPERFNERWQAALAASIFWSDEDKQQQNMAKKEAWTQCQELALRPDLLDHFVTQLGHVGLVGVDREAKLLYLAVTSRILDRPISIAVKGPSSAGKSFLVETVLSFFGPSTYYALTAMSDRSLAYSKEPLQHRMLVLYEADGMNSEMASYLIRSLLSEGCVRYETVQKTSDGLTACLIERSGPTGLIVTTTRDGLHPENETRLISLTLVDTPVQTRAILRAIATDGQRNEVDRSPWIALQQWIAASNAQVFIPFAQDLAALIPPIAVRLRRDFKLLLNLIKAHALLHQASRQRDEQGRVVVILEDYATIYGLVLESMAEGVQATISPSIRETVDAVRQIAGPEDTASVSEVAAYLQLDVSSASRRCQTAARRGYLRNEARSRGQTARYVIGDALPQEQAILPTVETLSSRRGSAHEGDCTIADETEGQDPPPLLQRRRVVL